MALLPVVCIVTNAERVNANLVWEAWGRGPETFMRKLCSVNPSATPETTPTHWLMADSSTTDSDVSILQGFADHQLPPLPSGAWGEGGIISAVDALAAIDGAALQVYSASGNVEPVDHVAGILAGRSLQYVPEPEI